MANERPPQRDDDLPEPIQLTPEELAAEADLAIKPGELDYIAPEPEPVEGVADEPIELVDSVEDGAPSISAFGGGAQISHQQEFRRPLNKDGTGATRCRIFHSRIAAAPLDYMQNQINQWIDADTIEVKHVGHTIGVMEGKTPEPNLIVMIWY